MNSNIADTALTYVNRGWMPVPLHGMQRDPTGGPDRCGCGTSCGKSAGKHPIAGAWQARDWRGWDGWPAHAARRGNIGIATGTPSGFWVLDYDPASAGMNAGDIVVRLRREGFASHVETGGGGEHWRFALPDFPVTNRRGRLPAGLDVRGTGGQVVAPPSVSGKGPYVELRGGLAVDVAPDWLLDLIRPTVPVGDHPTVAAAPLVSAAAGSDREQRYAIAALQAACQEYAALQDGRRGEAAWHLACRAVELMNLGLLAEHAVRAQVHAAIQYARDNGPPGGLADTEVLRLWERARAEVGDRRAEITGPDPIAAGAMPDGFALPFSPAPQVGATMSGSGWLLSDSPGGTALPSSLMPPYVEVGADSASSTSAGLPVSSGATISSASIPLPPMTDAGTAGPRSDDAAPAPASDPFDQAVRIEQWKIAVRDEARRRVAAGAVGPPAPLAGELIGADELDAVPDPVPVVDGYLYADTLARINGLPGQGKSFVAVDLACSVASGTPWAGRPVRRGTVLYMAAEGLTGLKRRVRAWESDRGVKLARSDMVLFPRPVQVGGPEWSEFGQVVKSVGAQFVIIDTQARVTAGRNENSALDMGEVVHSLEELRRMTGALVLLIHHAGKTGAGDSGRGINSVEGTMQSEFAVTKKAKTVTLRTTRQKDTDDSGSATFDLKSVQLRREVAPGMFEPDPVPAAVLAWRDPAAVPADVSPREIGKARQRALWQIMQATWGADGGTRADIRASFKDHPLMVGVSASTFRDAWASAWAGLVRLGLVAKRRERFRVVELENQSDDGVLTRNPGMDDGDVGQLGPSWTLWTPDDDERHGE